MKGFQKLILDEQNKEKWWQWEWYNNESEEEESTIMDDTSISKIEVTAMKKYGI